MRGVKRCKESTGRMRKHRYSNEFKVTAVKMASTPNIEVQAVAESFEHPSLHAVALEEGIPGRPAPGKTPCGLKRGSEYGGAVAEQKRIRVLEAALKKAKIENDLLKKAIQFNLERSGTSSRS